jgi:thiosulfate reductase cytochrome b subunit
MVRRDASCAGRVILVIVASADGKTLARALAVLQTLFRRSLLVALRLIAGLVRRRAFDIVRLVDWQVFIGWLLVELLIDRLAGSVDAGRAR